MAKETNDKGKAKAGGKNKIRPRAGEWGFLVRGKGKEKLQRVRENKNSIQ